jgi:hypothetical protein
MGRIILAAITFIAMCAITASAIGAFAEQAVTSAPAAVTSIAQDSPAHAR